MESISTKDAHVNEFLYQFTEWRDGIGAAIDIAIEHDDPAMISCLLRKWDTDEEKMASFKYMIKKAVKDGRENILRAVKIHNVNDIVVPETGARLLHLVGTPRAAFVLLEEYAQNIIVDVRDAELKTPLHTAVMRKLADVAKVLIEAGADVNPRCAKGLTPLHIATTQRDIATIRVLVAASSINVNARDLGNFAPLHFAAAKGEYDCVLALLSAHGCDVNAVMQNGFTPIHMAAYSGCASVVNLLVSMPGIDVNVRDAWGRTPLHIAILVKNVVSVKSLLAAGADGNAQDNWGRTPLHNAVMVKSCEAATVLATNHHINPNTADTNGATPLHHAAMLDSVETALTVVGMKGVNVDALDNNGETPMTVATRTRATGVSTILLSVGAH